MFSLPSPLCPITMEEKKLIVDGLAWRVGGGSRRGDLEEDGLVLTRRGRSWGGKGESRVMPNTQCQFYIAALGIIQIPPSKRVLIFATNCVFCLFVLALNFSIS